MPKCLERFVTTLQVKSPCFSAVFGIVILIVDQVTKSVITKNFLLGESISVTSFFDLARVHNHGITFGLLGGLVSPKILTGLASIIAAFLAFWVLKNLQYAFTGCLIIAGAVGNIIDRCLRDYVIDFLDFHILEYHWPAFNVADVSIFFGVVILFLTFLCENKHVLRK